MTLIEFLDQDAGYNRAMDRLIRVQQQSHSRQSRWGETRRFAGRSAGIQLDRIDKARESAEKAKQRAIAKFEKLNKQ
jgi:hypothetical protein